MNTASPHWVLSDFWSQRWHWGRNNRHKRREKECKIQSVPLKNTQIFMSFSKRTDCVAHGINLKRKMAHMSTIRLFFKHFAFFIKETRAWEQQRIQDSCPGHCSYVTCSHVHSHISLQDTPTDDCPNLRVSFWAPAQSLWDWSGLSGVSLCVYRLPFSQNHFHH